MKKTLTFLLVLGSLMQSCVKPEPIVIKDVESVTFKGITNQNANFEVGLIIENPNTFEVELTATDIDVQINNIKVGEINVEQPIGIGGNTTETRVFPVSFNTAESISNSLKLTVNVLTQQEVDLSLQGKAEIKGLFVKQEIQINQHKIVPFIKKQKQ